jgi:hypothetical protein
MNALANVRNGWKADIALSFDRLCDYGCRVGYDGKEACMSTFMVERDLGGISMNDLGGAQRAAIAKGQELTAAGTPVRYLRSTFAPQDGRCMCLFEADKSEDVQRLNDEAGLPYDRIVPALDLTP